MQKNRGDRITLPFQVIETVNDSASSCGHTWENARKYQVVVYMADILGNDTNKLLEVKIDED